MIIASVSSLLLWVKSSLSRARCTSSGCTQTSRTPSPAAIWSSTRHRCPVGSQATTTEENPAALAFASPHSTPSRRCHAFALTVRRANTRESWSVSAQTCLSAARSNASTAVSRVMTARSPASLSLRRRSPRESRRLPLDMHPPDQWSGTPSPSTPSGGCLASRSNTLRSLLRMYRWPDLGRDPVSTGRRAIRDSGCSAVNDPDVRLDVCRDAVLDVAVHRGECLRYDDRAGLVERQAG